MDTSQSVRTRRKVSERSFWLILAIALIFLIVVAVLLFAPNESHPPRQNEFAAIGALRRVNTLETQYAVAHTDRGFACELPLLQSREKVNDPYDPVAGLLAGEWSGYTFGVAGCAAEPNGIVTHYQVVAVPVEPGKATYRGLACWFLRKGSISEGCSQPIMRTKQPKLKLLVSLTNSAEAFGETRTPTLGAFEYETMRVSSFIFDSADCSTNTER